MSEARRDEICAVAIAEIFRGDGEILASAMGTLPTIGARLAKMTFEPDLLISDGFAYLLGDVPPVGAPGDSVVEGWLPFRSVFDLVWSGRRHVLMGATQIDRFGNQNISCIGDFRRPSVQLIGTRGAPGNTLHHKTSYWIPNHSKKVFVDTVDVVCGVGYDRAAALGPLASRFHAIPRVVSNLGVFDFETPERRMRLRSLHPEVTLDEVIASTDFDLVIPKTVAQTRLPTADELRLLREHIDPLGIGARELRS
ncbi:MAG: CoA-transferase [Deltaproteobacteria bacterium]|nr:CoA-transferase [Deltaproteobacteria bacterium]